MSQTIATLRHHKTHLNNILMHLGEIVKIEQIPAEKLTEMQCFAFENHDDLMRWEMQQAEKAIEFCHQINIASTEKRQHIARIAKNRFIRMGRKVQGARIP